MSYDHIEAVLYDLDGVLVESFTSTLTSMVPILRDRHQIPAIICTNQSGPSWREFTKNPKYPTIESLVHRFHKIQEQLVQQMDIRSWYIAIGDTRIYEHNLCSYEEYVMTMDQLKNRFLNALNFQASISANPLWRKPAPGMLEEAAAFLHVNPDRCLYYGDMETDRLAAHAARMSFELINLVA